MGRFIKGDIVSVHFPFSDLTSVKKRPALILYSVPGSDYLLCQITSQSQDDPDCLELDPNDFSTGALHLISFIKPYRVFTAHENLIKNKIGSLKKVKLISVINKIIEILQR